MNCPARHLVLCLALLGLTGTAAPAQYFDFTTWNSEAYNADATLAPPSWTTVGLGGLAYQDQVCQPSFLVGPETLAAGELTGIAGLTVAANGGSFGLAIGFEPGDTTNPHADYLLIEWRAQSGSWDYGAPSCTPMTSGQAGLSISRVQGIPTGDELHGHVDFDSPCSPIGQGVTELARAATLGSATFQSQDDFTFRLRYDGQRLEMRVSANFSTPQFELDLPLTLNSTRIALYCFREDAAWFSGFQQACNAAAHRYGHGVGGTWGEPVLSVDEPAFGATIDLFMENPQPITREGLLLVGFERDELPLLGGTILVQPALQIPVTLDPGYTTLTATLPPAIPGLCGFRWFVQLILPDATTPNNFGLSEGLVLQLGFHVPMPG